MTTMSECIAPSELAVPLHKDIHQARVASIASIVQKFNFWPIQSDPVSPFVFEDLRESTRKLINKFELKFASELLKLPLLVYPHLGFASLFYASVLILFLWILDDVTDETTLPLEQRMEAVRGCLTALKCHMDGASEPRDQKAVRRSSPHYNISSLLEYILQLPVSGTLGMYIGEQLQRYFEGVIDHLALPDNHVLSVKKFTATRVLDSACDVVLALGMLDSSPSVIFKSVVFLRSKQGAQAMLNANINVSYSNDLYSFPRDLKQGSTFNVILSLMMEHCMTEEEAMVACVQLSNQAYNELLKTATCNDQEVDVVNMLALWCRGSLKWHHEAKRNGSVAK